MKHVILGLLGLTLGLAYAQEEIVIRHWYHQYGEDGTFEAAQRYAAEYGEMTPGVTVEINWVPGDYIASLNAALLSSEAPDVFELQTIDLSRVRAGQLAPLDDLFEGVRDDFNETALERVTVDGTLYGVPMILDPQFLYYNESALAEAGLAPPTTMDELIEVAAALDTGRVKGLYLGNDLGSANYLLYMTTAAADTQLIADEEASFDTEANAEMWRKKQMLAQSGNLLAGAPTEWWDPSALIDGLTTMQWSGFWAMPQLLDAFGKDLGVAPWPAVNAGRRTERLFGRLESGGERLEPERRSGKSVRQVALDRKHRGSRGLEPLVRLSHPAPHQHRRRSRSFAERSRR